MTAGVAYLRRRTVGRAMRAYRDWVGRAVGWWTIVYLIAWLVVFVIAGLETLKPLAAPLAGPRPYLVGVFVASFVSVILARRAPPLILDRRDLFRLGLAPVPPWSALRWRFMLKAAGLCAVGVFVGLVWTALAPALFWQATPFAAPVIGLVLVARFCAAWLVYAYRAVGLRAWHVALLGSVLSAVPYGFADALLGASPVVLIAPIVVVALGVASVRSSLAEEWPPRFASQSLVLTQLQAMRLMQLMAGMAGFIRQAAADGGERRRLLAALYDTPGATRPSRSLPLPAVEAPVWRAFAWRALTHFWRAPWWRQVTTLCLALLAGGLAAMVGAGGGASTLGAAQPSAGALGSLFGGPLAVFAAAILVARAGTALLGPEFAVGVMPVDPYSRTLGRVAPAAAAIVFALLAASILLGDAAGGLFSGMALVLTVLLVVEKYGSWSGAGAARWEAQLVAALLAALPAFVLAAFGVPGWTFGAQIGLLLVVSLVGV